MANINKNLYPPYLLLQRAMTFPGGGGVITDWRVCTFHTDSPSWLFLVSGCFRCRCTDLSASSLFCSSYTFVSPSLSVFSLAKPSDTATATPPSWWDVLFQPQCRVMWCLSVCQARVVLKYLVYYLCVDIELLESNERCNMTVCPPSCSVCFHWCKVTQLLLGLKVWISPRLLLRFGPFCC